ncbi:MAG: two-component system response regulator [Flavobacteriales bacterium]|jgi:CheY-like chemotaxis protein
MSRDIVLVVDDDLTILELLRYQIADAVGAICDVELATSGKEVEELIQTFARDNRNLIVLVTDYFLDDTTGAEIIEKVKLLFPKCNTVLLTGQHQRDIEKLNELAVLPDRYFSKPWNSFELKSHLNNLVSGLNNN